MLSKNKKNKTKNKALNFSEKCYLKTTWHIAHCISFMIKEKQQHQNQKDI